MKMTPVSKGKNEDLRDEENNGQEQEEQGVALPSLSEPKIEDEESNSESFGNNANGSDSASSRSGRSRNITITSLLATIVIVAGVWSSDIYPPSSKAILSLSSKQVAAAEEPEPSEPIENYLFLGDVTNGRSSCRDTNEEKHPYFIYLKGITTVDECARKCDCALIAGVSLRGFEHDVAGVYGYPCKCLVDPILDQGVIDSLNSACNPSDGGAWGGAYYYDMINTNPGSGEITNYIFSPHYACYKRKGESNNSKAGKTKAGKAED